MGKWGIKSTMGAVKLRIGAHAHDLTWSRQLNYIGAKRLKRASTASKKLFCLYVGETKYFV